MSGNWISVPVTMSIHNTSAARRRLDSLAYLFWILSRHRRARGMRLFISHTLEAAEADCPVAVAVAAGSCQPVAAGEASVQMTEAA